MDAVSFGKAGLQGWRGAVADAIARPLGGRVGLDDDQVRAAVGALFFGLSVLYVATTVRRLAGGG